MKKEKIILQIGVEVDNLKAHVQRLKKDNYQLHPLDVELLQQKTRQLYEMLFELENLAAGKSAAAEISSRAVKQAVEDSTIPEKETVTEKAEQVTRTEETVPESPEEVSSQPEIPLPPEEAEKEPPPPKPEPKPEPPPPKAETPPPPPPPKPAEVRSNIDLFSETAGATLSDKFAGSEGQSLADKMQQSRITDLRQSIGINEKFLFINELFNGDMSVYNKAIDEINGLATLKGVQTFLMELKVQWQWDGESEAYAKLMELAERKFK